MKFQFLWPEFCTWPARTRPTYTTILSRAIKTYCSSSFSWLLQMGHCHAVAFLPNSPTGWEKPVRWALSVLMQFPNLFTWFTYTSDLSEISLQAIGMRTSSKRSTRPYSHLPLNNCRPFWVSQAPGQSSLPYLCFYCCWFVFVFACNWWPFEWCWILADSFAKLVPASAWVWHSVQWLESAGRGGSSGFNGLSD